MNDVVKIILSGIGGCVLTILTQIITKNFYNKKELLISFVESRYDFTSSNFLNSINRVPILFNNNKKVIGALERLHDSLKRDPYSEENNEKLFSLYLELCKAIFVKPVKKELFFQIFNNKKV